MTNSQESPQQIQRRYILRVECSAQKSVEPQSFVEIGIYMFFQNIGAYWTLIPENDDTKTKGRSEMESMSPPASTSVPSPPSNFRKRSSTMPTNLNRPQRPSKFKV